MSDSEDSTVTYTAVSSPFEGLSDIGSPGFDGPPVMLEDPYAYVVAAFQAPPSPDYVPGPEHAPPSPVYVPYVPEPVYSEFMPPEDEVLPAEEQPLPAAVSPIADSQGYIPESDLEEDPEKDPADYPADGGDDDDDDESSYDDEDDDDDEEEDDNEDEEGEEEHPALADSFPPPIHRVTTRISIPAQTPTPFWSEAEVDRLLAIRTSATIILLPIILSTNLRYPRPPLPGNHLMRIHHHRANVLDVCLPPQKRLCIAFGPRYEVRDSSSALAARPTGGFRTDYGFVATMDREIRRDLERDVGYRITNTWDDMLEDSQGHHV
ncbi:hypothetical protein Tco_0737115 [Tanacetum coccineum]